MGDLGAAGRMRIFPRSLLRRLVAIMVSVMVSRMLMVIAVSVVLMIVRVSLALWSASIVKALSVASIVLEPAAMMSTSIIMMEWLEGKHDRRRLGLLSAEIHKDLIFVGEPFGEFLFKLLHQGDLGGFQFLTAAVFIAREIQVYLTVRVGHDFGLVAQHFIDNKK